MKLIDFDFRDGNHHRIYCAKYGSGFKCKRSCEAWNSPLLCLLITNFQKHGTVINSF